MTRLDSLREDAAVRGLTVHTYSPGDGVTRYRFFDASVPAEQSYFGPANGVYTALGIKEARQFLIHLAYRAIGIG